MINGSARKQGNTFLALSEVAKTLEQQGIETEIVQTAAWKASRHSLRPTSRER